MKGSLISKTTWSWIEGLVLTTLGLVVSFKLNPMDPFFFHSAFPWIWLIPALLALRYGMGPSLSSVLLITVVFVYNQHVDALEQSYHRLYLLSGCILTLLCAEFSTVWSARVRRAEQAAFYAEHRLNQIAHAYHVISNSHTHLEQSLIAKPVTLRSAVEACVDLLKESNGALTPAYAKRFIELLAYYCNIEECALYLHEDHKLALNPIAQMGEVGVLQATDPLVSSCLQRNLTSFVAVNDLQDDMHSNYLVCAPLQDSSGGLLGLFVIKSMPFLALHEENLQLLTVLLGYYANQHWSYQVGKSIIVNYPTCPVEFAAQFHQLVDMVRRAGIISSVAAIYIKPWQQKNDFIQALKAQRRGLDLLWVTEQNGVDIVFVLMPFTAEAALLGYRNRIERWLHESYNVDLLQGPITIHAQTITLARPLDQLNQLIEYSKQYEHAA